MKLTAKELSGLHIGQIVGVKIRQGSAEELEPQWFWGTLSNVEHSANIIHEERLCSARNAIMLGRTWVTVTIMGDFEDEGHSTMTIDPATPITIQEGQ